MLPGQVRGSALRPGYKENDPPAAIERGRVVVSRVLRSHLRRIGLLRATHEEVAV